VNIVLLISRFYSNSLDELDHCLVGTKSVGILDYFQNFTSFSLLILLIIFVVAVFKNNVLFFLGVIVETYCCCPWWYFNFISYLCFKKVKCITVKLHLKAGNKKRFFSCVLSAIGNLKNGTQY
jgi:hypothetical protein